MASLSNSTEHLPDTSQVQNSVFMHAWNLMNKTDAKKSTVALVGSNVNIHDVLSELERMEEDLRGNNDASRKNSPSHTESIDPKKCYSGINCVLADDEKKIRLGANPSYHRNIVYDYAELVGQKPDSYSGMVSGGEFPPNPKKPDNLSSNELQNFRDNIARSRRSDYQFQRPANLSSSKLNSTSKSPLSSRQSCDVGYRSIPENARKTSVVPPVLHLSPSTQKSTSGDCLLSDDIQNQNTLINRNSININLTFAMGQYHNVEKLNPSAYYDVEEIKAPRRRATQRKEKAETSIQTDTEDIVSSNFRSISSEETDASQLSFDIDSSSTFPSVTPSRQNCESRRYDPETTVCIPETKDPRWDEYFDFPAVVAYTGESVKSIIDTADHIINNFIIMPDDNLYTEEELDEGEGKLAISVLRLLGVPQQLRHSIYNEALNDVQAIRDISSETVSIINHVIDWLCDGDGDGKEKLVNRVRRLASVTTDFQPDSDAWIQFESEFGIFTETVGEVMKQGYQVGADVARRFSETVMGKISSKDVSVLALPTTHTQDDNGNTPVPVAPASRRVSSVQMQPSLSSIMEESESEPEGKFETVALEAERDNLEKLEQTFKQIEPDVEADIPGKRDSSLTLTESPTWVSDNLAIELGSKKIQHGSNPCEWKRDAFMEAPIPDTENSITKAFNSLCDTLTSTFLDKTKNALLGIHGSGMTPILGESECSSRDERVDASQMYENAEVEEGGHENLPSSEIQLLAAEIKKLAVLTDSYFIDPKEDLEEVPEPEDDCPPPPVPKRQPSRMRTTTELPVDIDHEILLAEDSTGSGRNTIPEDFAGPWVPSVSMFATPDANDNTLFSEESPMPQISELMQKLKKFWPNKALSMILTPEAQLQYAMNSFFEENGSKTEIQTSMAALKILDKPKTVDSPGLSKIGSWTVLKLDGVQVTNEKDLDNEMNDLEKMIRDLNTEVEKKQSSKAVNEESLPETTDSPDNQEAVAVNQSKCYAMSAVEAAPEDQIVLEPEFTITPETQVQEPEEPKADTIASITINNSQTTIQAVKPSVSSRRARIPSRFAAPTRPIVRAQSTGSGAHSRVPKKPFVFGKAGIPATPRQVQKIKVIDTVPFPQPKTFIPRRLATQIRPVRATFPGSYAQGKGFGAHGSPTLSSRDGSRTVLSRSNSYRQLFQIKQKVAAGQLYTPASPNQSPNATDDALKVSGGPLHNFVGELEIASRGQERTNSATTDFQQLTNVAARPQDSTISAAAASPRKSGFWPF